jgi:opacity protein-like surface antigen
MACLSPTARSRAKDDPMKMPLKPLLIATAATAAISTAPAVAAEGRLPPRVVVVPPVPWAGSYVGIQAGWDSNDSDNGGIAGIFGGWNFGHYGPWVWGIDASINWTAAWGDGSGKGWLRARGGVPIDRALLYGALGAAGFDGSLGWTIGAGLDWAVTPVHFLRLDFSHQDYSNNVTSNTFLIGVAMRLY